MLLLAIAIEPGLFILILFGMILEVLLNQDNLQERAITNFPDTSLMTMISSCGGSS